MLFSTGYYNYVVSRPKLYEVLLKLVPAHKIQYGKRVLNIVEEDDKIVVHTSDNGVHEGDIVVGADGAYSAIRQRLYEQLKAKGELPESDHEDLPFSTTCLVGQTEALDPEEFPIVKEQYCQFLAMLGEDKPYTVSRKQVIPRVKIRIKDQKKLTHIATLSLSLLVDSNVYLG